MKAFLLKRQENNYFQLDMTTYLSLKSLSISRYNEEQEQHDQEDKEDGAKKV